MPVAVCLMHTATGEMITWGVFAKKEKGGM
jgi:hypothetical protein